LTIDIPRRDLAIVIVDDSRELIRVYEKYFGIAGLTIAAKFSTAKEVLSYFGTRRSDSADLIVLLDQRMPEVNALEIARQIKKKNPGQKIILTVTESPVRFRIDERLFDDMIFKPFTISELVATIGRVTSSIRIKGSGIFGDPEEIEKLFCDILSDSQTKLCTVRNPASIFLGDSEHPPAYLAAANKGLKVFLITEITPDNLSVCKQLAANRGIQMRHLGGVQSSFAVWDEKHAIEVTTLSKNGSFTSGQVMYSNLEPIVGEKQHLFEHLWKLAKAARERIRELDASPDLSKVTVVSGYDDLFKIRLKMVREAEVSLDISAISEVVSKVLIPSALQDHADAVSRGVRLRYLFEMNLNQDVESAKKLMSAGIEVRHLQNSVTVFGVSDKAAISMVTVKDAGTNEKTQGMFSVHPDYIEQYRLIFEMLWNSAIPASERIREIEEAQKIEYSASQS
jgi:CheY-like chemotaxis protein